MKNVQEMKIVTQRFGTFHREEKRDALFALRLLDFRKGPAQHQPRIKFHFGLEQRDLIERDAQRLLAEIFVLDVKGDPEQAHVARLKLRQEIRRNDIPARSTEKKTERQIEVQIDQPPGVETRNSVFHYEETAGVTASRMAPAAASFAPPWPSLAITLSKSAIICLRRSRSSSRRSISAAIADGCALP